MNVLLKTCYRIRNVIRRIVRRPPPSPDEVYRQLCELLSGDVVARAVEFEGEFRVDPRSHLFRRLLLNGSYEPHLVEICKAFAKLGGDFLDIGANIGFFSVLMAQKLETGRVLAVEPVQTTLDRLRENLSRNFVAENVILFEGAVLDRKSEVTINIPVGNEEFASQGAMTHDALKTMPDLEFQTQTAPTETLDVLVSSHGLAPSVMKVDTEGTEHLVFRGARQTLETHRPVLIAELNDKQLRDNGSSAREVMDLLRDCGYAMFDVNSLEPSEAVHDYGEVLCVSRSREKSMEILEELRSRVSN